MGFGDVEAMNNNWNVGVDFNFTPQIFTVTEAPHILAPECLDIGMLSGKSGSSSHSESLREEKRSLPTIEAPPCVKKPEAEIPCDPEVELDESDPAFALFTDAPVSPPEPVYQIFGLIEFEKAVDHFDIVIEDEPCGNDVPVSASTSARLERLSASLDSISEGLDRLTVRW